MELRIKYVAYYRNAQTMKQTCSERWRPAVPVYCALTQRHSPGELRLDGYVLRMPLYVHEALTYIASRCVQVTGTQRRNRHRTSGKAKCGHPTVGACERSARDRLYTAIEEGRLSLATLSPAVHALADDVFGPLA